MDTRHSSSFQDTSELPSLPPSDISFFQELAVLLKEEPLTEFSSHKLNTLTNYIKTRQFNLALTIIKENERILEPLQEKLCIDEILQLFICVVQKRERALVTRLLKNENLVQYLKGRPVIDSGVVKILGTLELIPILKIALSSHFSDVIEIIWDNVVLTAYCQGGPVHIEGVPQVIKLDELLNLFMAVLSSHMRDSIKKLLQNKQLLACLSGQRVVIDGNLKQLTLEQLVVLFRAALFSRCAEAITVIWSNDMLATYIKGYPVLDTVFNRRCLTCTQVVNIFCKALSVKCFKVAQDIWSDATSPLQTQFALLDPAELAYLLDNILESKAKKSFIEAIIKKTTSVEVITRLIIKKEKIGRPNHSKNRYQVKILRQRLEEITAIHSASMTDESSNRRELTPNNQPALLLSCQNNIAESHINRKELSVDSVTNMPLENSQQTSSARKRKICIDS